MQATNVITENTITKESISFYNAIAGSYETMLEQQSFNKTVRKIVATKFCETVKTGNVLDFGGGTGMDLQRLSENGYKIFFCEPSNSMRKKAIAFKEKNLNNKDIVFLNDDEIDFIKWTMGSPFSEKIQGVLSNFAVINCIPDINLLFKNLSCVMSTGANFIALVLDGRKRMIQSGIRDAFAAILFKKPIAMPVQHSGSKQTVFVYSLKEIKKASDPYFMFCSAEYLAGSGFCIIHLIKK